ncbi:DUF6134 family protein [Mangrovimonas futianensis]|uniref:DUF6134 family protein n=1 Tax=Mangrovimonas futianensis TaxID=2895523 RepID=UPI001E53E8CC|nr:DUF6134 family protein [Mangrovimonas futianensis]MCF1420228.1 hypothetical protein [Mangrovimonas futianensis]
MFSILKFSFIKVICFCLLVIVSPNNKSNSHKEEVLFNVLKNDSSVGFLKVSKLKKGDMVFYEAKSKVQARFIVNFIASGKDSVIFSKGQLLYSSQFRKINSRIKVNQSIQWQNGKYVLNDKGEEEVLHFSRIPQNLIPLFINEPGFEKVYSDKFHCILPIEKIEDHVYLVQFPNGDYNIYKYSNGICQSVTVKGTFFKVELIKQ